VSTLKDSDQARLDDVMQERDALLWAVKAALGIPQDVEFTHHLKIYAAISVLKNRRDRLRNEVDVRWLRQDLVNTRRELKRTQAALRFAHRREEQFRAARDKLQAREDSRGLVGRLLGVSIW
jgi:hypothetical protein